MSRFFRSLAAIFMPPFHGLGLTVTLYIVWAHLVFPHNDILRGNLPDPDDYMYLTQALDWLGGQGWYDNIQHPLDAPAGVPIHFSRFAQMPMVAGIWLFERLGLPPRGAATVTALIEPLLLLGAALVVLRRVMMFLVPARWAGASAYVALFSGGLLFEFMPGHVDHHGLVILLVLGVVSSVLRMIDTPQDYKAGAVAGGVLAVTLMIALEALPWLLLIATFVGLWAMQAGGKAARNGVVFGASLLGGSAVCLMLTRAPDLWGQPDILTYSATYVWLALGIAVPLAGVALAQTPPLRWSIGLGLALLSAEIFLRRFPEMVSGPYGAIDPQLRGLLLDQVEEALPLLKSDKGWVHLMDFMLMALLALPVSMFLTARGWREIPRPLPNPPREGEGIPLLPPIDAPPTDALFFKWALVTLLLAAALGLTVFYQYRFLGMAAALAVMPLTGFLVWGWGWIGRNLQARPKVLAEIGLLLLIAPLPALIVPALFDSRSFNTGFFLFPVDSGHTPCDMARLEQALRDPRGLGDRSRTILSLQELGPELLFRTPHRVLAAPFHMDVQGNLDAFRFLTTPYESEARNIATRRAVDLVVLCRSVPRRYLGGDPKPMMDRVMRGAAPPWLERLTIPGLDNFTVFAVRQALSPTAVPIDANAPQQEKYRIK